MAGNTDVSGVLQLPEKITPAIAEVLGQMPWVLQSIANNLRDAGEDIPRKAEAELAAAQFWLLRIALEHGDNWKPIAGSELERMQMPKSTG